MPAASSASESSRSRRSSPTERGARRTTFRRRRHTIGTGVFAGLLLSVLLFLLYASTPMTAEPGPLADVRAMSDITVLASADHVILSPAATTDADRGLIFFAGARVEPAAYANKLSGIARDGTPVVIVRPVLGFGILEWRPIDAFTSLVPGVDSWLLGGHSLGGVRACQYIADSAADSSAGQGDASLDGLVLFGSYCAANISDTSVPVLSIAGSEDGLSTPDKIEDAAHLLPASTLFVEIEGANHASFGDYGVQPRDGVATADDAEVTEAIATAVAGLD